MQTQKELSIIMFGVEHPQVPAVAVRLFTQTEQLFAEEQIWQFLVVQVIQVLLNGVVWDGQTHELVMVSTINGVGHTQAVLLLFKVKLLLQALQTLVVLHCVQYWIAQR